MDGILESIKKLLGPGVYETHFDPDIVFHINSAISTLTHLGVGSDEGFYIEGESEKWDDFVSDKKIQAHAKSYVYLKTRLIFDPPTSSAVLASFERQIEQLEWRLNERSDRG